MTKSKTTKGNPGKANASNARKKDVQLCATCQRDVEEACIGCDTCERWVHSTEMCSGLPKKLLDAITEHDGSGISFSCTLCRLGKPKAPSSPGHPQPNQPGTGSATAPPSLPHGSMMDLKMQLFQQIQGIWSNLQPLTEQMKNLSSLQCSQSFHVCSSSTEPSLACLATQCRVQDCYP